MDKLSLIGASLAVIALFLAQTMEGGHLNSLLNAPALLIVVGGSLGAVMIQAPYDVFRRAIVMFRWVIIPPKLQLKQSINHVLMWSEIARREGLLGLEKSINKETDPFIRKSLQLLIDGRDPIIIRNNLEIEIETHEQFEHRAAKVYESMGGYAPTIGILGAVMGLIHVMENLSEPGLLGKGIATAFVATVYGVAFANLFLIPVSKKLLFHVREKYREKEMLMEGIICIAEGENPRNIALKLKAYDRMAYVS